jgi:hypothetical protein
MNRVRLTESDLHRIIKESVNSVLKEGWVGTETESTEDIFNDIIGTFRNGNDIKARALRSGSGSVYEYLSDYIRDYYNVTLKQCDEICRMLKEYYNIDKFYYGD